MSQGALRQDEDEARDEGGDLHGEEEYREVKKVVRLVAEDVEGNAREGNGKGGKRRLCCSFCLSPSRLYTFPPRPLQFFLRVMTPTWIGK